MFKYYTFLSLFVLIIFGSCKHETKIQQPKIIAISEIPKKSEHRTDSIVIDSHYTFDEAISGSQAPPEIQNQLELITVHYYSTDNKIHEGQILTNKKISVDLTEIFNFILSEHFPVAKVIPVVKYNWNDNLSMQDNNSYSFCYRNIKYSRHAVGMAIDINPFFNPVRWKNDTLNRPVKPFGAVYNDSIPGTFTPSSPVIHEFINHHFHWGHFFHKKYDDHHFEK